MRLIIIILLLMAGGCEGLRLRAQDDLTINHDCVLITEDIEMRCSSHGTNEQGEDTDSVSVTPTE